LKWDKRDSVEEESQTEREERKRGRKRREERGWGGRREIGPRWGFAKPSKSHFCISILILKSINHIPGAPHPPPSVSKCPLLGAPRPDLGGVVKDDVNILRRLKRLEELEHLHQHHRITPIF
jgi:hypothetical protein